MKKLTLLLSYVLLSSTVALAQLEILAIAGPSFTNFMGSDVESWGGVDEKPKMVVRYHLGLQFFYPLNEDVSVVTGLQYAVKGALYSGTPSTIKEEYNKVLSYLDIPLHLQYALSDRFSLQGGFQAGILLSAKIKNGKEVQDAYQLPETEDAKDSYKGFDLAFSIGPVYKLSDKLAIQVLYQHGLLNIAQYADYGADVTYNVKNQGVKLSVTYVIRRQ